MSLSTTDLMFLSPLFILFFSSLIPLTAKILNRNQEPHAFFGFFMPVMGLIGAAGFSAYILAMSPWEKDYVMRFVLSNSMVIDGVAHWTTLIIACITGFTLALAREHSAIKGKLFSEFVFLLFNSALGMLVVAWSNDLIMTFIGIEMMSLCLYIMIAMSHEEALSKEAAMKYFVLGSFASAIFLYGIAMVFGSAGTTYLHDLVNVGATLISTNRLFLIGIVMLIVGFGFKLSIFPFHAWAPDVYQGSPTPVTGYMAAGVKLVTFVAFLRLIMIEPLIGERSQALMSVLQWLSVATMLAGNIAAIMQQNLKRMLAYSSIAHSGYLMAGLIVAGAGGDQSFASAGVIFYLFSYSIMTIGTFALISLFEKTESTFVTVDDLRGLSSRNPLIAMCMSLFMLSLAGVPPTVGFFAKFYLFSAAIDKGFYWLTIWAVLNSVISVYYYLRPLVVMYMSDEQGLEPLTGFRTRFTLGFAAGLVVIFGFLSNPIYSLVRFSVNSLATTTEKAE